ncbi:zinc-binding alcohol dehydrogenase family protein [Bradyrhizobium sp. 18BD]
MKAAVYDHNGPPEVFRYTDAPDPEIGPGDILIRVEANSVEGGDLINRRSSPPEHPAYVVGYAAAGTVVAIGGDLTDRKVGDRITSWGLSGSHAQLRAIPAHQTWFVAEAAAIPIGFGRHTIACLREVGCQVEAPSWSKVQQGVLGRGAAACPPSRSDGDCRHKRRASCQETYRPRCIECHRP